MSTIFNDNLVEALDYRLLNAWPSLECQFYDGWVARFANGYTKRANSVSPLIRGASLSKNLIDHVIDRYRQKGIRPTFRLTGLESAETNTILLENGFVECDPAYCMMCEDLTEFEPEDTVVIRSELPEQWLQDTLESQQEGEESVEVLRAIVSRIRQNHGFATLMIDDQPVAWGLGVVERGYVGLYEFVVLPGLRGMGLGKRVMSGLMAWGREHGAERAYLQVTETNTIARSLYSSLGFKDIYRYHYLALEEK